MNSFDSETGIEVRTIGDSRGYLWKIIMDKKRGIGKIEKVSGLRDNNFVNSLAIDGSIHALQTGAVVSDDMQTLTNVIESRFEAA
jgi:hypothetical protein